MNLGRRVSARHPGAGVGSASGGLQQAEDLVGLIVHRAAEFEQQGFQGADGVLEFLILAEQGVCAEPVPPQLLGFAGDVQAAVGGPQGTASVAVLQASLGEFVGGMHDLFDDVLGDVLGPHVAAGWDPGERPAAD